MHRKRFRREESTIRAVGIDEGAFGLRAQAQKQTTVLVAVMTTGTQVVAIGVGNITVDGTDSTSAVLRVVRKWRFDYLILSGITFAGFNIVDAAQIYRKTRRPVLVVSQSKPRQRLVLSALQKHFSDWHRRWTLVKKAGTIRSAVTYSTKRPIYFEAVGLRPASARRILRALSLNARIPEPVRLAGLVARGLTLTD